MISEFDMKNVFSQMVPPKQEGMPEGQSVTLDRAGSPQFWNFNGMRLPLAGLNPMIGIADRMPMGMPISFIINKRSEQSSQTMGSWLSDVTGINIDVIAAVGHFFNEVGKVFAAIWDAIIHIDWGKFFQDLLKVIQIVALVIAMITPLGIVVAGVELSALTGSLMVDIGSFLGDISNIVTSVIDFPFQVVAGDSFSVTTLMSNFFFGPKVAANSLVGGNLSSAFTSAGTDLLEKSATDIMLDYGKNQAISAAAGAVPGGGIAAGFFMDNSGNILSSIANADISQINVPSIDLSSIDLTTIPGAIANAISNISVGPIDLSNISTPDLSIGPIGEISIPEINIGQFPDIDIPGGGKKKVVSRKKKTVAGKKSYIYTLLDGSQIELADQGTTNLMPFFIAAGLVMMITGR